eukprot:Polyplicarium_translucidae@DN1930_c0_g1_i4.p1
MGCRCSSGTGRIASGEDIRDIYKIGKVLGSGAFGQVRECAHRQSGELFAVKIMEKKSQERGHWSNENMFRREVEALRALEHPSIIKYWDFFEDHHFLYAVMERCEGGELFEQILKYKTFNEVDASFLCRQMLAALQYVHEARIVHRDIKAENFLFKDKTSNSELKLIDFGMSAQIDPETMLNEVCGSPHYLAPELIKRRYSFKADVWALGVLLYLLLYGKYPFDGNGTSQIVKQILTQSVDYSARAVRPTQLAINFMARLLEKDPDKRASANEAMMHEWIVGDKATDVPDLKPVVRSALRKVTLRRTAPKQTVEQRRNQLLQKLEREWEAGTSRGFKVSPLNQEYNVPERRKKRLTTTPGAMEHPHVATSDSGKLTVSAGDKPPRRKVDFSENLKEPPQATRSNRRAVTIYMSSHKKPDE